MKILITGAGGFIGGHLVKQLLNDGHSVKAIDVKPFSEWYQLFDSAENISANLENPEVCDAATVGIDEVYNLACDMGGIGFIENNRSKCMFSVLINTNLLRQSIKNKVKKYFLASTACVYNVNKQSTTDVVALKEEDAYPALPEQGYGWEKLFAEQMCLTTASEGLIDVRIARFHNVYGPFGSWNDGREKAPAAICRKYADAKLRQTNSIEIWGDGSQLRSFMYIDDCICGVKKIMSSEIKEPINLGSSEMVSINQLCDIVSKIAGIELTKQYKKDACIGVKGRNSDNTKIKSYLGWEPSIKLRDGLNETYNWIYKQCQNQF